MVTEQQRLQLLSILAFTLTDMDQVVEGMSKKLGREVTAEEINAAIAQLKSVRGC